MLVLCLLTEDHQCPQEHEYCGIVLQVLQDQQDSCQTQGMRRYVWQQLG